MRASQSSCRLLQLNAEQLHHIWWLSALPKYTLAIVVYTSCHQLISLSNIRAWNYSKLGSISIHCSTLCVFVLSMLPSILFSSQLTRGSWKEMAGIITSQNTRWPLSSATATQHYHSVLHEQVDRSCVPQCRHTEGEEQSEEEKRWNHEKDRDENKR